jgi:hypothetical protein
MPSGAAAVTVPYVMEGAKPIVNVSIDGRGPFPFVVDTGGHFILTAQTAHQLDLVGRGGASSVNGHVIHRVGFTKIARLQIGGAVISDEVAKIEPYSFSKLERGPRPPKAGWLGLEFFERFAVTFDPTKRMMTLRPLNEPRPAPAGTKIPLIFDEDSPLTACRIERRPGVCMLDTGNAGATIIANVWAARAGLTPAFATGLDTGDDRVSRASVSIGPFDRPDAIVSYAAGAGAELFNVEAAVISEALIDGFVATFDYGRRGVWLKPAGRYVPASFNRSGILADKRPGGTFVVWQVIARSPASAAGIHGGDVITDVDGISASRFSAADFARINAAPRGTIHYTLQLGASQRQVTLAMGNDLLPVDR